MTVPLTIAIIFMAIVIYWLIRSRRKEAHHLDGLHLTPGEPAGPKND